MMIRSVYLLMIRQSNNVYVYIYIYKIFIFIVDVGRCLVT